MISPRYKELLNPYSPLRSLHLNRRAVLMFELLDPFQFCLPCWREGGSEDTELLAEMVARVQL